MILTVNRARLLKSITACAAVTDASASMSALANVKLDVSDGLVVTGSDTYTTVVSSIACHVESPGSCMVEAKSIRDIVASLPESATDVEIERENMKLTLRCGRAKRTVPCLDADSYPAMAKEPPTFTRVTGPALLRALAIVNHAVSTDESRPNYCGINVTCGDGLIIAQSTDGHRIAHTEIACETGAFAALLPGRGVKAMRSALTEVGVCDVDIGSDGNHATLKSGDTVTTLRLAEAAFPPTRKAFELPTPNRANVNREILYSAIKGARVTSKQDGKDHADSMVMTISSGEIGVSSRGVKGESSDVVECDYDGDRIVFGFQPSYMMDMLSAMQADDISIWFNTPLTPMKFTPATTSESRFIVLPQAVR